METPDGYQLRIIGGGLMGTGGPALVCERCACLLPYGEESASAVHDQWHARIEHTPRGCDRCGGTGTEPDESQDERSYPCQACSGTGVRE